MMVMTQIKAHNAAASIATNKNYSLNFSKEGRLKRVAFFFLITDLQGRLEINLKLVFRIRAKL